MVRKRMNGTNIVLIYLMRVISGLFNFSQCRLPQLRYIKTMFAPFINISKAGNLRAFYSVQLAPIQFWYQINHLTLFRVIINHKINNYTNNLMALLTRNVRMLFKFRYFLTTAIIFSEINNICPIHFSLI